MPPGDGQLWLTIPTAKGSVTDIELLRDIGAQCGQEAMRVVSLMNEEGIRWMPGKQRGRPVRVKLE